MPGLRTLKDTDLSRARLDRAQMDGASLQDSCLAQATLREARLDRGLLKNCDLTGSDAWHLVARAANFVGSRVARASWRGANLMQSGSEEHTSDLQSLMRLSYAVFCLKKKKPY